MFEMKEEEIIQLYSKYAKGYDKAVFEERDYIAYKMVPEWIIGKLSNTPSNLLDLGCGTGLSSLLFFKENHLVTGIDISPEMVQEAKKYPYQTLYCQSLEEPLPFFKSNFDAAVMLGVMEFIQNPLSLFNNVKNTLKKEGLFGLTIPQKLPKKNEKQLQIFSYTQKEIESLFTKAGFSIDHMEPLQGFVSEGIPVHYFAYLLQVEI